MSGPNLIRLLELAGVRAALDEAIPMHVAKPYRKAWDPSRYEDIFQRAKDRDRKAFRIYLPIKPGAIDPPDEIADHLREKGYEAEDYVAGMARQIGGKRRMKIGRLLSDDEFLSQQFMNDPARATGKSGEVLACISRHPYDIAGMSTGRGWTSCMSLGKRDSDDPDFWRDDKAGEAHEYVLDDVKEGTIIAYMIRADDRNIENPIGRVLIKPFVNKDDPNDILLARGEKTYGTTSAAFLNTVDRWLEETNGVRGDALYCLKPNLYADGEADGEHERPTGAFWEVWRDHDSFHDIENPTPELAAYATRLDNSNIRYIKDRATLLHAISKAPTAIRFVRNPDVEVQMTAVKANPKALRSIRDPQPDVVRAAFAKDADLITELRDPPEEWKLIAVSAHPDVLSKITNPSETVIRAAADADPLALRHVREVSNEIIRAYEARIVERLKDDPWKIVTGFHWRTRAMLEAALRADYRIVQHLKGKDGNIPAAWQKVAVETDLRAGTLIGWNKMDPAVRDFALSKVTKEAGATSADWEIMQFAPEAAKIALIKRDPESAARMMVGRVTPEMARTMVSLSHHAAAGVAARAHWRDDTRETILAAFAEAYPEMAPYLGVRRMPLSDKQKAQAEHTDSVKRMQELWFNLPPRERKGVEILDDLFHAGIVEPLVAWARSKDPNLFPPIQRRWVDREDDDY